MFSRQPRNPAGPLRRTLWLLPLLLVISAGVAGALAFRSLVTELAVSSARDEVVLAVNTIVKEVMAEDRYRYTPLVALERDESGSIAAIQTNVAEVNSLAAEVLALAMERTAEEVLTVGVPVGNLMGSTLLLGKGPSIPAEVVMLSSSTAGFRSELAAAGINQTRHQILLELTVDISLMMPWRTVGTQVQTEILVSDTVIVGAVPESYLNWQG